MRFRYAITEAIKYSKNEEVPSVGKVENLRKDISNIPKHILGDHTKCSKYFCRKETVDTTTVADMKLTPLYDKLMEFERYLANHSKSLIYDVDNNCAEQFNSVIARHSGGKSVNYVMKRSYQTRCFASVVALNSKKELSNLKMKYGRLNDPFVLKYEFTKQKQNDSSDLQTKN
ncbi:hypothetical protein JTB14_018759 [Gonioctena quinquepunctata]|nr:hypothetical protein JTB14_018759 [Gonioctena quinquepunctata]